MPAFVPVRMMRKACLLGRTASRLDAGRLVDHRDAA
jgi:hypothetical protein